MPCSSYKSKKQRRMCFATNEWTSNMPKRKKKAKKRRKK